MTIVKLTVFTYSSAYAELRGLPFMLRIDVPLLPRPLAIQPPLLIANDCSDKMITTALRARYKLTGWKIEGQTVRIRIIGVFHNHWRFTT